MAAAQRPLQPFRKWWNHDPKIISSWLDRFGLNLTSDAKHDGLEVNICLAALLISAMENR